MKTAILALAVVGCSASKPADGEPQWGVLPVSAETTVSAATPNDGIIYFSAVDTTVQDILSDVADRYFQRLGINITVVPEGGIPVFLSDLGTQTAKEGVSRVMGSAHVEYWCAGSSCNDPIYGASLSLDSELWGTNGYTIDWKVVAHEVAHIISGWGVCYSGDTDATGSHLNIPLNLMSPYTVANTEWSDLDDDLICSCGECPDYETK